MPGESTLALPAAAVQALRAWRNCQTGERLAAGDTWHDTELVFTSHHGAPLDAGNVRKMFERVCAEAGAGDAWTPREPRTSFASLMSHQGVSIEEIARLVGHATTRTTDENPDKTAATSGRLTSSAQSNGHPGDPAGHHPQCPFVRRTPPPCRQEIPRKRSR
jgi:site-specific recombinase XerD